MWMLKDIGVDWRDRNLIANLYLGQKAVVRINRELSGCCIIGQGVWQGCPLSPLLFNIYIRYVINEALEDVQEWVKVGGARIPAVRFADDQAMVSHRLPYEDCKLLWMHCRIQGGAKNGAILSHCKYSENSMTDLRGNWWTSAIMLNAVTATVWCSNLFVQCEYKRQ